MDDTQNVGLISRVNNWMAHPFNAQGTVLDWFLFLGVICIAAFLWSRVIREIEIEI